MDKIKNEVIAVLKVEKKDHSVRKVALGAVLIALFAITLPGCVAQTKKPILQIKKLTQVQKKEIKLEEKNKILAIKNFMKVAAKNGFSGGVLVALKGKVILSRGYGMADKEEKIPCTEKTRFMIASLTKQFTSMAIMQLEEKGLLSVKDKVEKYLPGFPRGKEITIHQLLSHTSGLPSNMITNIKFKVVPSSVLEALSVVEGKGIKFVAPPGKKFSYSNMGYEILGIIIQKVTGKTYEDYVEKNIFSPLGMVNSGFGYNRKTNTKLAKSYTAKGILITKNPYIKCSIVPFSAAEIYTTVEDLYKWNRALYTEKLVSKETLTKIFTPVLSGYGYGWMIKTPGRTGINGHSGNIFGFYTIELRIGKTDSFYVIFSNKGKATLVNSYLARELLDNFK